MTGITKAQQLNKNSIKFQKGIKSNISTKIGTRKKEARKWIHLFIRMRDVILRGDGNIAPCCTCPTLIGVSDGQCGHYKHGILDNEYNLNLQCTECNTFEGGRLDNYYVFLKNLHGEEKAEELRLSSKLNNPKYKWYELYEIEQMYKMKVEELKVIDKQWFKENYKYNDEWITNMDYKSSIAYMRGRPKALIPSIIISTGDDEPYKD